jgi:tetratricopeptide (TPR) repeat protein
MTSPSRLLVVFAGLLTAIAWATADEPPKPAALPAKLPLCGLAPAKLFPDNCVLRYRISTQSPQCQAYFDQGLGYFYSYVWMEAARSFETAAHFDPDCAMAWWGLSRALEPPGALPGAAGATSRDRAEKALQKAKEKQPLASHSEQMLIKARLQEKGLEPGVPDTDRRKTAAKTIDQLLVLYDVDEEAWYYRAQLADSGTAAVPYYKALLRINPLHPGANHELVHFYENQRRPALGWINAENYMKSSPGIPHAFHMQAHLAMRLGRWDKTADRSAKAIELERAYHKAQGVRPAEDHQFSHHLETLTIALTHDGRFAEARKIKDESWSHNYRHWMPWFRLHLAQRNWDEALKVVNNYRRNDKQTTSYLSALIYLKQGNAERASAEVEVLRQASQTTKANRQLEHRLWETQGLLMCQTGSAEAGLKLLAKVVERTKDDYAHHAWGNGAAYMESWGIGALKSGQDETAEEAFLEALAHEPSCVRAALGLQVLCERQGRMEEARRYEDLARRCWQKADAGALGTELTYLRELYPVYKPEASGGRQPPSDDKVTK